MGEAPIVLCVWEERRSENLHLKSYIQEFPAFPLSSKRKTINIQFYINTGLLENALHSGRQKWQ